MQKGDKIRFLDAVGGGVIVQYDNEMQQVWVETEDGFAIGPVPANKCVLCESADRYQRIRVANSIPKQKDTIPTPTTAPSTSAKKQKRQRDEWVIDLHISAKITYNSFGDDVVIKEYTEESSDSSEESL